MKQIWYVSISDANGNEIARREFSDGTSEENYERAEAEHNHMMNYKFIGFWSCANLSMREVEEE